MQAYCVKCRKKVQMRNSKAIIMKNKRPATQGVCVKCGTKVFRIGEAESLKRSQPAIKGILARLGVLM